MKRRGTYLNEIVQKNKGCFFELNDAQREQLKLCLLGIMKDVLDVCDKHGLTVMMSGGSCLGTVRHKGFIPWDDDIDLMMLREDYEKLIDVMQDELGGKYDFSVPKQGFSAISLFLKIYKKGTVLSSCNVDSMFRGVHIDIFPLDNVPDNPVKRFFKSTNAFLLRSIAMCVKIWKIRKTDLTHSLMAMSWQSNLYYNLCKAIGCFFSIVPMQKWFRLFDKYVTESAPTANITIPAGRALYNGELLPINVFVPVSEGTFEGIAVKLPHDVDAYLTNLYGDYMTIPPVEKRERHFYTEFDLGDNV